MNWTTTRRIICLFIIIKTKYECLFHPVFRLYTAKQQAAFLEWFSQEFYIITLSFAALFGQMFYLFFFITDNHDAVNAILT